MMKNPKILAWDGVGQGGVEVEGEGYRTVERGLTSARDLLAPRRWCTYYLHLRHSLSHMYWVPVMLGRAAVCE